ncbi:DMT family transporter [Paenibacillus sp. UMB4589-SE434]|uniref:DMT family transporter n=1 Tax=Paenibacillus sp. UMB4589-SE434 TaxID=3046314 RepID=UPI00254B6309|nr:DMT family transporter [Paenibacillus sp. UMB4589-SE434]MDK8182822.1 DMT family transporter [Paenibacillus sp. UMB4589-SE434]
MDVYLGVALVLCSALTHSIWNLFAKRSLHKSTFLWSLHVLASIIFMPFFVQDMMVMDASWAEIGLLVCTFLCQGLYFLLLSKAYQYGELSRMYPMMRGTGALLVPVMSMLLYGESLTALGWLGLICIVGGLFAIGGLLSSSWREQLGVMKLTFAIGLCITGYTLIDKSVVTFMSPLGLLQLSNLAALVMLFPDMRRAKRLKEEWRHNWKTIILGAFLTPGSYLIFLFAMNLAPLAQLAPLREFSIVFGTILGMWVLKEKQGMSRIVMSLVITCGMLLVGLFGSSV